ncbi:sarcosine oxidase subunit gamma [Cochlodiniinecator piscidefendens]|uniref:sarcosine oxidase subunit gamma n=1 Tax=Cochlodiniinecator piscidefendens TaxID=2715756 RepID=UPI00140DA1CB|nr:sarcosine oxidase, gamma subunit [Cochlodiniinecator piscidefendens]
MHNLGAITPLGRTQSHVDQFDGLRICEVTSRALASLSARLGAEKACGDKATKFTGLTLPSVGKSEVGDAFSAFWMGPEQWMIDADYDQHTLLAAELKSAMGDTASVVEQTDAWCRFDLEGPRCADVFERLCNVDARGMTTDDVTRTRLEHLGCFVWCLEAANKFAVIGPRSSAKSIHHALVTAARSAI